WFDRSGRRIGLAGTETGNLRWPSISAKGRIAFQNVKGAQIWVIDNDTSPPTQFTFSPITKSSPLWSSDGSWLAFYGFDGKVRRKRSNGTGSEEVLLSESPISLTNWSPDGKSILLTKSVAVSADIEVLTLEGSPESRPYLANPKYAEARGVFSRNG